MAAHPRDPAPGRHTPGGSTPRRSTPGRSPRSTTALGHAVLALFGLDGPTEDLYRVILTLDGEAVPDLCDRTGVPEPDLRHRLQELTDLRLVQVAHGAVHAEPPDLALGRLVSERAHTLQHEEDLLAAVRVAIPDFVSAHERGRGTDWEAVPVEAIESRDLLDVMETLVRNSTGELLFFRPDQFTLPSGHRMDDIVLRALHDGRASRTLYPASIADDPPERVRRRAAAGERVRVLPAVPTRLAVFGHEAVIVPEQWDVPVSRRLVVRQPALVRALIELFDVYWQRGVPVPDLRSRSQADAEGGGADELLALLARGAKDEQVARVLGVSLRTVRRRVADLMAELGVESRFQAGVEAVRRGLL